MGKLFDIARQIEPWLLERGLSRDDIRSGLVLLVGDDWDKITASEFIARLQERGFTITRKDPDIVDDIEALVRGTNKLESFRKHLMQKAM